MAFGDDAQNTWDKMTGQEEKPLNDQLDEQSNEEIQESMAADSANVADGGFREHIGQDGAVLRGDMGEADPDSDRDYDTDMEEPASDAFTDRDSF